MADGARWVSALRWRRLFGRGDEDVLFEGRIGAAPAVPDLAHSVCQFREHRGRRRRDADRFAHDRSEDQSGPSSPRTWSNPLSLLMKSLQASRGRHAASTHIRHSPLSCVLRSLPKRRRAL